MSRLRDKRQKQSVSVNSAAVRLCALRGSCRLPYLRGIARIASLKSKLPIVPGERGISQLVNGPDGEGYTGQSNALVLSIHGRRTDNGESIEHLVMLFLSLGWVTFEPAVCPNVNTIWWIQSTASDLCKNDIITACLFGNTWRIWGEELASTYEFKTLVMTLTIEDIKMITETWLGPAACSGRSRFMIQCIFKAVTPQAEHLLPCQSADFPWI